VEAHVVGFHCGSFVIERVKLVLKNVFISKFSKVFENTYQPKSSIAQKLIKGKDFFAKTQ